MKSWIFIKKRYGSYKKLILRVFVCVCACIDFIVNTLISSGKGREASDVSIAVV